MGGGDGVGTGDFDGTEIETRPEAAGFGISIWECRNCRCGTLLFGAEFGGTGRDLNEGGLLFGGGCGEGTDGEDFRLSGTAAAGFPPDTGSAIPTSM